MTPPGETYQVTTTADRGPGSLRQGLSAAERGDTITFDTAVFDPDDPATVHVLSELPHIRTSHLTIDASAAGVVLDGSRRPQDWLAGMQIVSATACVVRGMYFRKFPGPGIAISGGARDNVIGWNPDVGVGPSGQGNVFTSNVVGVDLAGSRTANNVVAGNLVGTGRAGMAPAGNRRYGIAIAEGAHYNVIGPGNVITSSGKCGVAVTGEASRQNRITRNRLHDNGAGGICLLLGGNEDAPTPLIVDVEWSGGRVTGVASSGGRVEVFSDGGDEGETYEGQTTAGGAGRFTFEKGRAFTNPNVTLTVTDRSGNTSELSRPAPAGWGPLTLQLGNSRSLGVLRPKPSGELADNDISATFVGPQLWEEVVHGHEQLSAYLLDLGVKRINTSLNEVEPPITWGASEFEIPPAYDRVIDTLRENDVGVNYMLHFWDKAGRARGETLSTPRFRSEAKVEDFIDYVRFVVSHFRGRVQYYTLWTEPDNCHQGDGIKCINVEDYIELAKRVIPVVREEDPQARVSVAPVVLFFERDFLPAVLRSEVGPWFDVMQWHGQYDVKPDNEYYGSYYHDYASIVSEIRAIGSANGFDGEYWSTDMNWSSAEFHHEPAADQPWVDIHGTDKEVAKYYARGIVMHRGMGLSPGLENGQPEPTWPWSHPTIRQLCTVMAGVTPIEMEVQLDGSPPDVPVQRFAFEHRGGDKLFTLWTDGVAREDDPGQSVTLMLPGLGGRSVWGIDVLQGFEQPLLSSEEDGSLVIRDLLLKDYPIILRIAG